MTKQYKIGLSLLMTFIMAPAAMADNEIYIDQVGGTSTIVIEQDGSNNLVGGDASQIAAGAPSKFILNGDNINFNSVFSGSSNKLFGAIYGDNTVVDLDVTGSSNNITFDVDPDNVYGAGSGDFQIDISGGNNTIDWGFGRNDAASNADVDLLLDGDFNTANISVSDVTLNWDFATSNSTLDYTATGYDGHTATITGDGDYMNLDLIQSSTLSSDTIEIEFDGNGTSTSNSVICIQQSDSGTATSNCGN
jgi:hypothetical protein